MSVLWTQNIESSFYLSKRNSRSSYARKKGHPVSRYQENAMYESGLFSQNFFRETSICDC